MPSGAEPPAAVIAALAVFHALLVAYLFVRVRRGTGDGSDAGVARDTAASPGDPSPSSTAHPDVVVCRHCGTENGAGYTFCRQCVNELGGGAVPVGGASSSARSGPS